MQYSPLSITTSALPGGAVGTAYGPASLSASGGSGSYSWSLISAPAGISLTSSGILGGTPTATGSSISVNVTDFAAGLTATQSFPVVITPPALTLSGAGGLGGFVPGANISVTFTAAGGVAPYKWSAAGIPAGLSLNATLGAYSAERLRGQAVMRSPSSLPIRKVRRQPSTGSVSFSVMGFTTGGTLPVGSTATPYSLTFNVTGGSAPYTFTASALPDGLSLAASGLLSGSPKSAGSSAITVQVKDSKGLTVSSSFSLTVTATTGPLLLSGGALPHGSVAQPYSQALQASGGTPPYILTLLGGMLPDGLSLASGTVSGTPKSTATATFTARATDAAGASVSAVFTAHRRPADPQHHRQRVTERNQRLGISGPDHGGHRR